ncbi:MAG: hypothetical protein Q8N05_14530 [Bacteroidota bacterium]|nr:hypothetical protein [Bacteroidota bacterium]
MKYSLEHLFQKFIISILALTTNISIAQNRIEGLMYLDQKPVSIEIKEEKIVSVQSIEKLSDESHPLYIAPGLIDNQVNGFAGVSFCFAGGQLTKEGILKATQELWKKGVTTYSPTLTTNSQEVLLRNFTLLASSKNDESIHGSIAGYHLEFIRKCTALGITVAIGHHNATKPIIDETVLNGARIATHLGNGCANMINRHANPLWPQLANDQLMASIICDGFHLRDEEIEIFYRVKGPEKTIITSDVTSFAALPPGEYKNEEGNSELIIKKTYVAGKLVYDSSK